MHRFAVIRVVDLMVAEKPVLAPWGAYPKIDEPSFPKPCGYNEPATSFLREAWCDDTESLSSAISLPIK